MPARGKPVGAWKFDIQTIIREAGKATTIDIQFVTEAETVKIIRGQGNEYKPFVLCRKLDDLYIVTDM